MQLIMVRAAEPLRAAHLYGLNQTCTSSHRQPICSTANACASGLSAKITPVATMQSLRNLRSVGHQSYWGRKQYHTGGPCIKFNKPRLSLRKRQLRVFFMGAKCVFQTPSPQPTPQARFQKPSPQHVDALPVLTSTRQAACHEGERPDGLDVCLELYAGCGIRSITPKHG